MDDDFGVTVQYSMPSRRPSIWMVWLFASRPATLLASITPVLAGTAAAIGVGGMRVPLHEGGFIAASLAALFLQIAANYSNDLFDFERGADRDDRIGPIRVTHVGWVTPFQIRCATIFALAMSVGSGVYLTTLVGWPVLAIGAAAIIACLTYTGGPWPYGYHGFGEPIVFFFFGIVAVMGSFFIQTERITLTSFAVALPLALTVTALLTINNLRDLPSDLKSGKRTLAVIFGPKITRTQIQIVLLLPFILILVFCTCDVLLWWALQTWLLLPFAAYLGFKVSQASTGPQFNALLKQSGVLHFCFGFLLSLSFFW